MNWITNAGVLAVVLTIARVKPKLAVAVVLADTSPSKFQKDRAAVITQLKNAGGKHLVIIRYATTHNLDDEWVFNRADIDRSPIIWAREMESLADLRKYYSDRQIWLLEPDASPFRLNSLTNHPANSNNPYSGQ